MPHAGLQKGHVDADRINKPRRGAIIFKSTFGQVSSKFDSLGFLERYGKLVPRSRETTAA